MAERKPGRPPAGRDSEGKPVAKSLTYPQITARVRPEVKETLETVAFVMKMTQAAVIEGALDAFIETLPASKRKTIESLRGAR